MQAKVLGGYPVDKLGNILGPEYWDSDVLPSDEEVRRSHSDEFNKWFDERLAKAKAGRLRRFRANKARVWASALAVVAASSTGRPIVVYR